jgi:hypothetical protein
VSEGGSGRVSGSGAVRRQGRGWPAGEGGGGRRGGGDSPTATWPRGVMHNWWWLRLLIRQHQATSISPIYRCEPETQRSTCIKVEKGVKPI